MKVLVVGQVPDTCPKGNILVKEKAMKYDYLVVGAGLYGAVFAHEANARGKSVLVVERSEKKKIRLTFRGAVT